MSTTPTAFDAQQAEWQTTSRVRLREFLAEKERRFLELDEQLLERANKAAVELQRQAQEDFRREEQESELELHRTAAEKQAALLEQLLSQMQQPVPAPAAADVPSEEFAELAEQLAEHQRELEQREQELVRLQENLEHRERETDLQRKKISRQLAARKAELLTEVERQRAEAVGVQSGQATESQARLAEERARADVLEAELRRSEEQCEEARRQIKSLQADLAKERSAAAEKQAAVLEQLVCQVQQLEAGLQPPPAVDVGSPEFAELTQQLEEFRKELEQRELELDRAQEKLEHRERETDLQRKNISRQMWARKAELLAEAERQRAEAVSIQSGQEMKSQIRLAEELARTERLQSELRRAEQQFEEARKLITDLKADLDRERSLAREQDQRRRSIDDERVSLTAEVERLRVTSETALQQKARLEEELQRSRDEAERKVNDLRNDQGKAFDEHLQQLFTQIDALTRDRQRALDEQAAAQELVRGLEAAAIGLRSETRRLEEELQTLRTESELEQEQFATTREELEKRVTDLRQTSGEFERTASDLQRTIREQEQTIEELRTKLENVPPPSAEPAEEIVQQLAELREQLIGAQLERDQLERQLLEAQETASASVRDSQAGPSDEDLQRRLQMAIDECRELRSKNQDLTEKLAQRPAASGSITSGGGNSWEEQKRRLMEQLENDFDEGDSQQKADKLTVSGAIRITDQVIADKEREIEELHRLLENQSNNIGDVAVGAAAIAGMLDQDELILHERQNLQELKNTLNEKLRTAEVEISVERAKLARERQELEEKLRTLELERSKAGVVETGNSSPPAGGKQNRGAWLTRLGLKDKDGK